MGFTRLRVCAALSACALLLVGCATARTDAGDVTSTDATGESALAGVYARMAISMSHPGEIYQPTISMVEQQGTLTFSTRVRTSVDVAAGSARGEVEASFSPENVKRTTWILNVRRYHQTLEYDPTFMREAATCRGASNAIVGVLLACRGTKENGETTMIADADYHGQPAIALLTEGSTTSPKSRSFFTDTLFLDRATYLPIAQEGSGRVETLDDSGNVVDSQPTGRLVMYAHAFVPADDMASYHFDPTSIGYLEPDLVSAVTKPRPDFTMYWLGADAAIDDQPPIAIRDALIAESGTRPAERYRAILTYRPVANEFGPTLLELQQWRLDDWRIAYDDGYRAWPDDLCVVKEDLSIEGMAVTLYHGYTEATRNVDRGICPTAKPDRYIALVTTASSIVRISAPDPGFFNTADAMRGVIEALVAAN